MTEQELKEIEARADAATPGKWGALTRRGRYAVCVSGPRFGSIIVWANGSGSDQADINAEFIAHAREDVPALIAEVRLWREWRIENQWRFFKKYGEGEYRDFICGCFVPTGSGELRHADSCPDFTPEGELK